MSSLQTGTFGGYCNVMINLKNVTDADYVTKTSLQVKEMLEQGQLHARAVLDVIEKRISV